MVWIRNETACWIPILIPISYAKNSQKNSNARSSFDQIFRKENENPSNFGVIYWDGRYFGTKFLSSRYGAEYKAKKKISDTIGISNKIGYLE